MAAIVGTSCVDEPENQSPGAELCGEGCQCEYTTDCDVGGCRDGVCSCHPIASTGCPCHSNGDCALGWSCANGTCEWDVPSGGSGPGPGPAPGPICGDGICSPTELCALDCMPVCPTVQAGIAPTGPPYYECLPPDSTTLEIVEDLNTFWQSSIYPCVCGAVTPLGPYCAGNAFAHSSAYGYIYYDYNVLGQFQSIGDGSLLAPAWLLAHEAGHLFQLRSGLNTTYNFTIESELAADCFAGYFIGWLACNGEVNEADVYAAMSAACSFADPQGLPWFNASAHGDCDMRVAATLSGLNSYVSGLPAVDACR